MKKLMLAAMLLGALQASAKTLTVNCAEAGTNRSLALIATIENVNTPMQIQTFAINGDSSVQKHDNSAMPIYQAGNGFNLRINFGPPHSPLFSSATISVTQCADSFLATGKADVRYYVGGFAGTDPSNQLCTCNFQ